MAGKKNKKIVKYRSHMNINVGMIIFFLIFLYMTFNVYAYLKKEKIQFYEVVEGNIVNDHEYTGIAIRDEHVQYTEYAGYINYYVREGKRAGIGTRIYSIDETGSLAGYIDNGDNNSSLTDANIIDIKRQLASFSTGWSDMRFEDVYDIQSSLEASVLEYVNFNTVGSLDALMEQSGAVFQQVRAPQSGVVSYAVDGFEDLQAAQIQADLFAKTGYEKAITKAGQQIAENAPVYKLITSDNWSIIFPLTEADLEEYSGKNMLHVTFLSNGLEVDGEFSVMTGLDGASYGKLDFDKYMVQFAADRFIRFEVDSERVAGLKIPVTAVSNKSFYLIPAAYLSQGGDSSESGFYKEVYSEAGTSIEFVPTTIYYSTGDYYYIDMKEDAKIRSGDYLVRPDSSDRYQVGPSGSLQGVYNINKGYAVFKQIEILNSNDEYYTIRKGTDYGLSVYDHIVLNADTVYEGQLVYQ